MFRPEFRHLQEIERKRIVMPDNVVMRLNRLEKPEPWSSFMQGQIRHAINTAAVQQYPAYQPFYDLLVNFFALPRDRLVVGAGIEEFVRSLFMLAGGKVAFLWPTCAMFELYGRIFNVPVQRIAAHPYADMSAGALLGKLDRDVKLLLLANPGQPVDTCFDLEDLRTIATYCHRMGITLAIDEAYFGFGAPTGLTLTEEFGNLTILRTFSKAWGAASIRLGFAVSSPAVHAALNAVRQSGEVSAASMAVASTLMREWHHVTAAIDETIAGREHLQRLIRADLTLSTRGAWANHVLIGFPSPAYRTAVAGRLAAAGVLTKADYPAPLDRHMLVTCGSPALMTAFFDALRAAL